MMPAIITLPAASDCTAMLNEYRDNLDVRGGRTKDTYVKAVSYYLDWLQAEGRQGNHGDVIAYREHLMKDHKPGTVCVYIGAIRSFYRIMSELHGIPDVAASVKGAKKSKNMAHDALTVSQAREVLAGIDTSTIAGLRDYAMINLMIHTGMRENEVAMADVGDIRNVGAESILYVLGKGHESKDDYVILDHDTLSPIQRYLSARGRITDESPLFASLANQNQGGRMTTRAISGIGKQAMRNAGIVSSRLVCHSFRHTACTLALKGGASLLDAQVMMRHVDPRTTMYYVHQIERTGANAGERCISRYLGSVDA